MKLVYRPEIDGLRAIAVGAVILYHSQITLLGHQIFKGGFIGVDIFFVISGYLITSLIFKELITTGSFSFKHFYERRIRRILPVLLFVILVSLPFGWMYLLPSSLIDFSKSILFSLGFSSNFYFYYSGQEYGAINGISKPFLHTWSLSVEEQYYILFPILLLFIFKYFKKYLIHSLFIGFIISLILADWTSRNFPSVSFYFIHTRIWEILSGSILAYLEIIKNYKSKNKILNFILAIIGLLIIVYSILFFNDDMFHPSFNTLYPILGTCLIIWFSNKNEIVGKMLSSKLFIWIGLISYSLYLWHYPIFSFVDETNIIGGNNFLKIAIFILMIFLSIFSYLFIERPARSKKFDFKILSTMLVIKFILIIIFCLYSISLKIHPIVNKHQNEENFKLNYDFDNFDNRKNIFIVGNSYADDLLNLLSNNKELNKDYYFYTVKTDPIQSSYQIYCFNEFLIKEKNRCGENSFLTKQYKNSDFLIFAEVFNRNTYIDTKFNETIKILKKDKKKFIIFLDDVWGAHITLDSYLYKKQKIPPLNDLNKLEKSFFKESLKYKNNNNIQKLENILLKNKVTFITRSELFCDFIEKKCPLIINNEKLYKDYGHLTINGAKYFSNKGELILQKLLDK